MPAPEDSPVRFGFLRAEEIALHKLMRRGIFTRLARAKSLFHYTSLSGFQGIIQDGGFWLSDTRFMNDSEDASHGVDFVCAVLERQLEKSRKEQYSPLFRDVLWKAKQKLKAHSGPRLYAACFSEVGDDLSQWRAYDGGMGVSLELDAYTNELAFPHIEALPTYSLGRVVYCDMAKRRIVISIVQAFWTCLSEEYKAFGEVYFTEYVDRLAQSLLRAGDLFKNSAFMAERELRIIYTEREDWQKDFHKKSFRHAGHFIVPYFKTADFPSQSDDGKPSTTPRFLPLKAVTVGPCPYPENVIESLRGFLNHHGYHQVDIKKTKIPFRR